MDSPFIRKTKSKTGCLTCKQRRKKCDETRPVCERCVKANTACLGYSYLENLGQKAPKRRSKAATRQDAARPADDPNEASLPLVDPITAPLQTELSAIFRDTDRFTDDPNGASLPPVEPAIAPLQTEFPAIFQDSLFPVMTQDIIVQTANSQLQALFSGLAPNGLATNDTTLDFSFLPPEQPGLSFDPQFGDQNGWDANLALGDMNLAQPLVGPSSCAFDGSVGQSLADSCDDHQLPGYNSTVNEMTSSQESLFNAWFSLGQPVTEALASTSTQALAPDTKYGDGDSTASDESDIEGIKAVVCATPTLDSTIQSNSLPYILQGYANYMVRTVYEPLRIANGIKDWLAWRHSQSGDSQITLTMFGSLLNAMWTKRAAPTDYNPIVSMLNNRVRRRVIETGSGLALPIKSKAEIAQALLEAVEMMLLEHMTSPTVSVYRMLIEAAPLYRRLCREPPHEPIDIARQFTHPNHDLRQFAATDITMAAYLNRPMLFRYHVQYNRDEWAGTSEYKGLQWLNGVPDQITFLLARMNMLRDDFASNVDPAIIAEIEQELKDFKPQPGPTTDSYLMIARLAIQECWRLVMFIYLYMGLCGANAKDPRVEKAHKSFIRLLDRTKPDIMLDSFLNIPMLLGGVATYRQRDQNMIRQRILAIPECAIPGTRGNDQLRVLEDIWARTRVEGRPSVWGDLRISSARIMGI